MMHKFAAFLKTKNKTGIIGYEGVNTSISREAKDKGFPINEKTTWISQYYIACRYIVADLETRNLAHLDEVDYIILDRSILDSIPYVVVADQIFHGEKKMIKEMLFRHFELFPARLIYCKPLNDIRADGARSSSQMFQRKIQDAFTEMLHVVPHKDSDMCTLINEPIEDRMLDLIKFFNLG